MDHSSVVKGSKSPNKNLLIMSKMTTYFSGFFHSSFVTTEQEKRLLENLLILLYS